MKKVISMLLVFAMVLSMSVTTVFAEQLEDVTTVTYNANETATEYYTITVPASLDPGDSGTVKAWGKFPNTKTLSVTAESSVKLTCGTDVKTLAVIFPGISLVGSVTEEVSASATVGVANFDATVTAPLFGTWSGVFYYNVGLTNSIPTVEDLQEQHEFEYYSTMNLAVTDVNNGTIGASADVDKEDAVAGIYTDESGGVNVVLLQDTTEETRIQPSVDMTINLGGYTLSADDAVCINVLNGNLTIDGQLSGSAIEMNRTNTAAVCIQIPTASVAKSISINGGTYSAFCETGIAYVLNGRQTDYTATITDCNIRAYSNYTYGEENYYDAYSYGIRNDGTLTLNDCYVMGTHSGISNHGTLYVNGGTYEGYGHGGFYFSGADTTSYVRNAIIRQCAMPDGYTATAGMNGAGFYIGGSGGDNISVYMDNCDIYGSKWPFVLRGTSGEQNNSLYISNSNINLDYSNSEEPNNTGIRIDDTHTVYMGVGNNFTAENTTQWCPGTVVVTDETYIYNG